MNSKIQRSKLGAGALALSLAAALIVCLMVGLGGAAADSGSAADDQGSVSVAESPRPIFIGEPGPGAARFGALKPASAASVDSLPETVKNVLASVPEDPSEGANASNPARGTVGAVANGESAIGTSVGFVEVNGALCLFAAGQEYQGAAVGSCPSLAQAEAGEGYVAIPGIAADSVRVIGVAPDGVTQIGADGDGDGSIDRKVEVVSNLYQLDLPPSSTEISGLTSSGETAFQVTIPLDRFASMAGG
jgi:hypothetical protein